MEALEGMRLVANLLGCASVSKAEERDLADARRLSGLLGVPEAALVEALPGLNRCIARRIPRRRVYKPLDLSILTTCVKGSDGAEFGGRGIAGWPDDLAAELARLSPAARTAIETMLRELHTPGGCFPRIGQGCLGLHKALPSAEHAPLSKSYDSGCRFFNMTDPFVGTPMDAVHDHASLVSDLASKDTSGVVYTGMINPVGLSKLQGEGVNASIELHRSRLVDAGAAGGIVGRQEREGQPFIDCYFLMSALAVGPAFSPDAKLQVDVVWRAMEELVFNGTVRSLGVCNCTLLQLQGLLEVCRIRPAAVQFEHHPYVSCNEMDDFVSFVKSQGIALIAHTPLAQASQLEDERLAKLAGLTAAQATLRYSLDRGFSVLPGASELWHIVENQATPLDASMPELRAREGGPVGVSLANINDKWGAYTMVGGGGSLRRHDDGHLYASHLEREAQLEAEEQIKVSVMHAAMFAQLTPIIDALPQRAAPAARRRMITAALHALGEEGRLLGQMQVVPYHAFVGHGSVPRRSCRGSTPLHVSAYGLGDAARIVFISQRWLRREHPDDEAGSKHKCLRAAVEAWATSERVDLRDVYVWFDYCSIDQDDFTELFRCVNSLGLFICCADVLISFDHPEYWARAWCLAEQMFGDAVRLPRLVLRADRTLHPLDTGAALKQALVNPSKGQLTVEADRPVIEVLKLVAAHIRSRLWFGSTLKMMSLHRLECAIDASAGDGANLAETVATHGAVVP